MWLVTGSSGFIGSHLVSGWQRAFPKQEILHCDYIHSRNYSSPVSTQNIFSVSPTTVHPSRILSHLDKSIEGIVHLGARASTLNTDSEDLIRNNVLQTMELFNFATQRNIPFIFASSASVYGNGKGPLSLYAQSKKSAEDFIIKSPKKPKHCYILRLFNVYGPGEDQKGPQMSMVSKAYSQIYRTGRVTLFDTSETPIARDFVYIKDVIATMTHLRVNTPRSGIYDVGTGNPRTFEALVEEVFKNLGATPKIDYMQMPEFIKKQYQTWTCASKFIPGMKYGDIEEGVKDFIKNHEPPWRGL